MIIRECKKWINCPVSTIQELAELIGYLNSCTPAVAYSPLYLRELEICKIKALKANNGDYSQQVKLSNKAILDLKWWCDLDHLDPVAIREDIYDSTIFTDASTTGWGAHLNEYKTRGIWNDQEIALHINVLELKAIELALKVFSVRNSSKILIRTDSTTAISYINKYGGCRSRQCHEIARKIWIWCEERKIILFASYISSANNVLADKLSRMPEDRSDFALSYIAFDTICNSFGYPDIDYFASSCSTKCNRFYSWYPCEGCEGVDAFSHKWMHNFYAFPPFSMVGRTLKKILSDEATGIVVVPKWDTQPWYPLFLILCKYTYIELKSSQELIVYSHNSKPHELSKSIKLLAAKVSSKNFNISNPM
jgi:ribonuclease HI